MKDLTIIVWWEAWYWVESLSKTLSLFFMREWFHILTNSEYENRIRGWHVFSCVRVWEKEVQWYKNQDIDVLIAMDKATVQIHENEMKEWWIVIYDPKKLRKLDWIREDLKFVPVEMQDIANKVIWMWLARNVVAAWALLWVLDYEKDWFKEALTQIFKRKWDEVVNKNHQALDAWFEEAQKDWVHIKFELTPDKSSKRFMMHWNEAITLWAIKAGCKYLSAYPMTPGSTVMTTMAKEAKNYNIVVSHVEDEIAAVCNAIWAWYTWIRAMTSTSWWWFALMWEAVWLSWMIEAPVLIVNAQRPWPSTWLPTRTGQWDLRMAMHCGQWDIPRLVLAPWDQEECIRLTFDAFNFVEKYQIPAILLTEKYLADTYKTIDFVDFNDWSWVVDRGEIVEKINENGSVILRSEVSSGSEKTNSAEKTDPDSETSSEWQNEFKRFKITENWVSARSIPWVKNWCYTATSYEHNEYWKAEEEIEPVIAMQEKRLRKLEHLKKELPMPILHWEEKAEITLVWWWATKWILIEAIELLKNEWISANFIQFQYLFPFKDEIEEMLKWKNLFSVETNATSQLAWIIRQYTWVKMNNEIVNLSWRQITPKWVAEEIKKIK